MIETDMRKLGKLDVTPTLFVGCGGTGYEVLIRVKAKVEEFLSEEEKRKVDFVIIDTDPSDQAAITSYGQPVFFSPGAEMISIGAVPVQDIVDNRDNYPVIKEAFDLEDIPRRDLRKGAKQVRQLGRLALFYHYDKVRRALNGGLGKIINKNTKGSRINMVNIIIVSSAAGGTGSGIVIDVAYLCRHLAKKKGLVDSQIHILGYLAMPEYFNNLPIENERQIRTNTFALLTEIDHFADYGDFVAKYPEIEDPIRDPLPPFSRLHILDANDETGKEINGLTQLAPLLAEAIYLSVLMKEGEQIESQADNLPETVVDPAENDHEAYASIGVAAYSIQPMRLHAACSQLLAKRILRDGLLKSDSRFTQILQEGEPEDEDEYEAHLFAIQNAFSSSGALLSSGRLRPGETDCLVSFEPDDVIEYFRGAVANTYLWNQSGTGEALGLRTVTIGALPGWLFSVPSPGQAISTYCDNALIEARQRIDKHTRAKRRELRKLLFEELEETCKSNVHLSNAPLSVAMFHLQTLQKNLNWGGRQIQLRRRRLQREIGGLRRELEVRRREMENSLENRREFVNWDLLNETFFNRSGRQQAEDYRKAIDSLIELEMSDRIYGEAMALFEEYSREILAWKASVDSLSGILGSILLRVDQEYDKQVSAWQSTFVTELRLDSRNRIESVYHEHARLSLPEYTSSLQQVRSLGEWLAGIRYQEQNNGANPSRMEDELYAWLNQFCEAQMGGILNASITEWFHQEAVRRASQAINQESPAHIQETMLAELYETAAPLANFNTTKGGFGSNDIPELKILGVPNKDVWQHISSKVQLTLVTTWDSSKISALRVRRGFFLEMLTQYTSYGMVFAQQSLRAARKHQAQTVHCFEAGKEHTKFFHYLALGIGYGFVKLDDKGLYLDLPDDQRLDLGANLEISFRNLLQKKVPDEPLKSLITMGNQQDTNQRVLALQRCLHNEALSSESQLARARSQLFPLMQVFARAELEYLQQTK